MDAVVILENHLTFAQQSIHQKFQLCFAHVRDFVLFLSKAFDFWLVD